MYLISHKSGLTDQFLSLTLLVCILQLGYLTAHVLYDVLCCGQKKLDFSEYMQNISDQPIEQVP